MSTMPRNAQTSAPADAVPKATGSVSATSPLATSSSAATPRHDAYETVTARVLEQLQAGTVPWRRPWTTTGNGMPRNLATGRAYRGANVVLLWMTAFESPWWLTYKQAQALDGQVRKGEVSTPIVVWKRTVRHLNNPAKLARARKEGRQITTDQHGRPVCRVVFSRLYRAFNIEQIDGLEGHPALQPVPDPDWDPLAVCEQTVDGYPNSPSIQVGGQRASYQPASDLVRMPDHGRFTTATDWYATLFHELGHSTGAASRLNRPDLTDAPTFDSVGYAREELTAELAAAMLCAHCRIDSPPLIQQHAAYLDHWRRKVTDDPRLVVIAAQRAQRACDLILNRPTLTGDAVAGTTE